jgi:secreted PhoX family phosphatase
MKITRRKLFAGASSLAFAGMIYNLNGESFAKEQKIYGYGPLKKDPHKILDLPEGFSYRVISSLGDKMDDGFLVPDRADGMGCIALDDDRVALIRNHEINLKNQDDDAAKILSPLLKEAYDHTDENIPHAGGTTTIIYDLSTDKRTKEFYSLIGTLQNCAGGITPWGSWLSCEENVTKAGENSQLDHGWIFEVPATQEKLKKPFPLKAMGRFNHEAAAVDPKTGIVYLTEDRPNSLFYRFIPNEYGKLHLGGKLQALAIMEYGKGLDTRNWQSIDFKPQSWRNVKWIDLNDIESPKDDLRIRGYKEGAATFARGEGIHWGDNELYFCCTSGGKNKLGQVMRYQPSKFEGTTDENNVPGKLQLFFESQDPNDMNYGDNIVVTPFDHLLICEDQYTDIVNNYIRGLTPEGQPYPFAKLVVQTEPAGCCFSPDGKTMFVNVYRPTMTLAITGPWNDFRV